MIGSHLYYLVMQMLMYTEPQRETLIAEISEAPVITEIERRAQRETLDFVRRVFASSEPHPEGQRGRAH